MEYTHYTDLFSMLEALAAGLLLGVYYDAFRLLRRMVHFDSVSVAVQDMIFWLTSAVYIFFVCIRLNNGYIRIYFILFALAGWGIYYATLGRILLAAADFLLRYIRRLFKGVRQAVWSGLLKIYTVTRHKSEKSL